MPPQGRIEVDVPYDGHDYFTRQAYHDIKHQLDTETPPATTDAIIGHFVLSNHEEYTDLQDVIDMRYGDSVSVHVPVVTDETGNIDQLINDKSSCVFAIDYSPKEPRVVPLQIEMSFFDEDASSFALEHFSDNMGSLLKDRVTEQIQRDTLYFRSNIVLAARIFITLPQPMVEKLEKDKVSPIISKFSINWPTTASHGLLELRTRGASEQDITTSFPEDGRKAPMMYNPETSEVEWSGMPMKAFGMPTTSGVTTYSTKPMYLKIHQPGDLYGVKALTAHVEAQIPGDLLSGVETPFV